DESLRASALGLLQEAILNDPLRGFRVSSARRGGGNRPSLLFVAVAAIFLLTAFLVLLPRQEEAPPPPLPQAPTTTPSQSPSPTPTALSIEQRSGWVVTSYPAPTPTPWPTAPPAVRPSPRPTPLISECVTYSWTSIQVFRPSVHVKVDINVVNRCSRDLSSLDLWFEITGWREGDLIQSVRGHPFEGVRRGFSTDLAIGLPGSIDWYDEITVEIID
ncbi:MAG: hypothetical protein ACC742_09615, partial [Thermoanaerobaculales bacterium]